uniref:Dynein regulatory complex protein 9 n=1 Tax=Dunaliella tertiolecta TaxID=3047 RepID=A0A6S8JR28_DUNTE|mmetsp:Transcript_4734/g.12966  ORF Transcript_4734/g.12966 Transcript_4734/m.12966 type:complete len:408 (+) Transcript_4734:1742-2965(+)|eukprot:CAMPEP_0202349396 /NCGR_PEP_ID=MMETSP1126-20121109/6908_1 /ASSEMBLY_ACC=CAM_ASM_000457 /TAXON_ID=3047 /ORGANISM="Dunaliella tertiolecta, Strain CCMP1320" /LENGTH=407 /DNA_ID=CAMNT_0048941205 /DNA_START=799 /DNA_END=2022 /DNA_ORIENTATION=+
MALVGEGKVPPSISRLAADQTLELSPVEAAHVYAVLKRTLDKLALVGIITVDPKVQAQELTQSVGEEITRMIAQQKHLEQRFEELVSAQHHLRHLPNKSKLRENQAELQHVAESLRQSTKQLCRNLKDNPNVQENMAKVATERQSLAMLMSSTLTELDVYQKVTPIVASVLAHEAAKKQMERTIEHERTTTSAVKQLRNDLKDEKIDHEDKMREKKKVVEQLKHELKELHMATAVDTRFLKKDCYAGNETLQRLENTQLADMRKELTLIQQQLEIETGVHETSKEFLKRLSTRLQEESINWNQRHDDDLQAKDRDLELLKQNHIRDERRLKELEEKYKMELTLKGERDNKEAEEREKAEMDIMLHDKRLQSAIKIQAVWRGFLVRRGPSKKKGKAGKKGKSKSPGRK